MSILNGDTGIKILDGFNVFLSNQRNPINPNDAHGFIRIEIQKPNLSEPPSVIETLFTVETTIHQDVFQIIDENKMAIKIAGEIQKILSIAYFGLTKMKIKVIGIATGYNNDFNVYEVPNG